MIGARVRFPKTTLVLTRVISIHAYRTVRVYPDGRFGYRSLPINARTRYIQVHA